MPPKRARVNPVEQMTERAARWKSLLGSFLVLAVFTAHPLMMNNSYYNITVTKGFTFAVIVGVSVSMLAMILFLASSTVPGYFRWTGLHGLLRAIRPYEYALIAYWLVMALSALQADYPRDALLGASDRSEGLLMMTAYLLAAAIAGRYYRPKRRDLLVLCIVATAVAAYGICQYYGFDFLSLTPDDHSHEIGPALLYVSTMSNRNVLSAYLCLAFCICAVLFTDGKLPRWGYLAMGWIQFYMLILGVTESGYIGLLLSVIILFPLLAGTRRHAARFLFMMAGCLFLVWLSVRLHREGWAPSYWEPFAGFVFPASIALAALAALLYFLPRLPDELPQRLFRAGWYLLLVILVIALVLAIPGLAEATGNPTLRAAAEILEGNFADELGSNRMFVWKRALTMIPDRLLLGHGPDNFYQVFAAEFGEEGKALGLPPYDKIHNEYLEVLFDIGLSGLLSLLAFFALVINGIRKRLGEPMALAVLLALVCFMIQAFFNIFTPFAHPVAWVLWGFLAALAYRTPEEA